MKRKLILCINHLFVVFALNFEHSIFHLEICCFNYKNNNYNLRSQRTFENVKYLNFRMDFHTKTLIELNI